MGALGTAGQHAIKRTGPIARWRVRNSAARAFRLGAPSSSRIEALTKSEFFVGNVPYALWTCPKQCSLGFTRMTARRRAGHPPSPLSMPSGPPCVMSTAVSWGMVRHNASRLASSLIPKAPEESVVQGLPKILIPSIVIDSLSSSVALSDTASPFVGIGLDRIFVVAARQHPIAGRLLREPCEEAVHRCLGATKK